MFESKFSGQATNKHANKYSKSIFRTKPKLFKHLKYIFLIVFIVLLVVQLRAIELPSSTLGNQPEFDFNLANENNHRDNNRVIIAVAEKANSTLLPSGNSSAATDDKRQSQPVNRSAELGALNHYISLDGQDSELAGSLSDVALPASDGVDSAGAASTATRLEDLLVAPSANEAQVQHVEYKSAAQTQIQDQPYELNHESLADLGSNLAELTAAGTAAGLMVHDLMSRANMQQASSAPEADEQLAPLLIVPSSNETAWASASNLETNDDADDGETADEDQLAKLPPSYSSFAARQMPTNREHRSDSLDDESPAQPIQGRGSQHAEAYRLQRAEASPVELIPEPPGEDQMPDSMDSLMRSEGRNVDTDGGDQVSGDQRQDVAGSTNIGDHSELASQPMIPKVLGDQHADSFDADDGLDDEIKVAQDSRLQANHFVPLHQQAGVASSRLTNQAELYSSPMSDSLRPLEGGEVLGDNIENKLVAPMRDSLSDLNTAAGHYYGKKKKKKVIVIKKKKKKKKKKMMMKKKKKYVKKKEVKVIKLVKKKKPKKMKHHHHDHGKYYMYAKVPKKKSWEFGFKKGNKKHWIERHEKGHKNKFKTNVKWYDKKSKGKGVHIWDYNHHDKKKKHYG